MRNWRRGEYDRNTLYKTLKKLKEEEILKRLLTQKHTHTFNIKSHAINFLRENTADTKDNGAGKVLFTNPTKQDSGWGALRQTTNLSLDSSRTTSSSPGSNHLL